jgi:SAM-dependent methyltransferase
MADVQTISYGTGIADEAELRLCGDVKGKRVIELGAANPGNAVALASRGAKTIVVDPSADRIAAVRSAAEAVEVRVECHQVDLADLGFATSASVDLVLSVLSLTEVDDLSRVFRQVHRVLRTDAAFVLSVPHPLAAMLEGGEVVLRRSYWSNENRTVSGLFTALSRANFLLDVMQEPEPTDTNTMVPRYLVLRARKLGV